MPAPETSNRYQTAVLWPTTTPDAFGQLQVGSPIEIRVRWNTKRSEAQGPNGGTITLDGQASVLQDIAIGSHMWLGTLEDFYGTGSGSAEEDTEVMRVATFNATPDIKNRYQQRTVGLQRLRITSIGGSS